MGSPTFFHPVILKFLIAAIFSVTDCKELKLAQTALINLIGIYGYIFYELNRVLMRKNVNSEVTMNPPIQHHTYPDEYAPAAAYDRILPFLYPGYQRFFLAWDEELRRPQADTSLALGRRHERRSREKKLF